LPSGLKDSYATIVNDIKVEALGLIVAVINCPYYLNEISADLGIGDSTPRHQHGVWIPREPSWVGGEAI
jgi:hypothetical protein